MKIIVDIENKTLKMLENERSIFKGEYGADKLILLLTKPLVSEYPVITGLLSNGRKIGGYTTDSSYGTERIDGVTYTTAEFTLSKENGFTLSEGVMQVTIWIYTTKDSEVISKTAIGNITFNVVNTTAFNDGDIIIAGDVEGTVVNLKVEVENLQQVAQINNVAINNLQNKKADKTTLNDYLKHNGSKPMTGDLDMDDHSIKNVSTIEVEGAITTGSYLLSHDAVDDIINGDYHASYYYASGIRYTQYQGQEKYDLYFPAKSGTFVVRDNFGIINDIGAIRNASQNSGIEFGVFGYEIAIYNPDSMFGLSSTNMMDEADLIHNLKYPDTSETTGDGSWETYTWNLPKKSGTIALDDDIPTKTSQLVNDSKFTTQDDLNDIVAIAQGKTKTYVIEASANSFLETTSQEALSLSNTLELTTVDGKKVPFTDLIKGDVILITDINLPDRFVGSIGEQVTFYPLESRKMDLDDYALKTEIPTKISQLEQDVELGVSEEDVLEIIENNSKETNTLAIGTSKTFDETSDEELITSKGAKTLVDANKITKVSELENDKGYLTEHQDISNKLDKGEFDTFKEELANGAFVVDSATYAEEDVQGNNIIETYMKKSESPVETGIIALTNDNEIHEIDVSDFLYVELTVINTDAEDITLLLNGNNVGVHLDNLYKFEVFPKQGRIRHYEVVDAMNDSLKYEGTWYNSGGYNKITLQMPGDSASAPTNILYRGYR